MSLVAAYSDSENESESDNEIPSKPTQQVENETVEDSTGFVIEDEDDWQQASKNVTSSKDDEEPNSGIFLKLPEPSKTSFTLNAEEEVNDEFLKKKPSQEDSLYKKEQALLEKERAEKATKGKTGTTILSKFAKGDKKKNQKVKISIPTLQEVNIFCLK